MILVDMNQVTISNLMMQVVNQKDNEVNEDMVRHMVLNSLRSYRSKFYDEYGELVICYDGRNYWRREIFPFYKQNRKVAPMATEPSNSFTERLNASTGSRPSPIRREVIVGITFASVVI